MKTETRLSSSDRLLLIDEVRQIARLSKPRIYHLIAAGRFPEQVHLSDNRVAWIESEILDWLNARVQERRCNKAMASGSPATGAHST